MNLLDSKMVDWIISAKNVIWNKKSWRVSWFVCSMWYKCIEIYELDPAHFLSAPGLAWQACLKKTKVELELLIDTDMLLMVEKEVEFAK